MHINTGKKAMLEHKLNGLAPSFCVQSIPRNNYPTCVSLPLLTWVF